MDGGGDPKPEAELNHAPCGRLVVRAEGEALWVEEADPAALILLGLPAGERVDLQSRLGATDTGPVDARLGLTQPVTAPVNAPERRWVDLRFHALGGERFAVSVVDATAIAEQRRHDEVRRQYLARLSDLALMFAFTNTLNEASVVEVACSAARRMASAERATYYRVETFSEDQLLAKPTRESRSLRTELPEGEPPTIDLGRGEVALIDAVSAGPLALKQGDLPQDLAEAFAARGSQELVILPVFRNDAVGGLMVIESLTAGRDWLLEELELLQAAMALFGAALDRLMARLDLERSEAFSGSVVSAIADGILVVDDQQRITMANPSACEALAQVLGPLEPRSGDLGPAEALIAAALDTDGNPMDRADHPILRALTLRETVEGVTLGLPHGDGRDPLWLELSAQPLLHAGQGAGAVVVSFSDVTQRRRYEAELLLARDAALDASRLKGAFLANMSHEIRTPMNGVIGTAALLLESGLSSQQREYARTLKGAAESLLTILDDVLDLSKIEAGRIDIESIAFDPVELVDGVLELLGPNAAEKDLALHAQVDEALWARVLADPHRTRQVLNNLVGNAIKFTDRGTVSVRVSGQMRERAAWLRFEVSDTGIGMSPDTAAHAFDRFTQADTSTTRRFGGTGLGLSISKQLVELMGGDISIKTTESEGSCFTFDIPAEVVSEAETLIDTTLAGKAVLVAVDEPELQDLLSTHLRRWGMEPVATAAFEQPQTPDKALAAVIVHRWDVETMAALLELGVDAAGVRLAGPMETALEGDVKWPPTARDLKRTLRRAIDPWSFPGTGPRRELLTPGGVPTRVLVVEDQPVNQLVARSMLELLGCKVTIAKHGAEAVRAAQDEEYEIVFMDCQMPIMDGFEATRRIREAEPGGARLPIVAVSASAMGAERQSCEEAGMDDFLAKPVRLEDFEAALHRWVERAGAGEAADAADVSTAADQTLPLVDGQTLERLRAVKVGDDGVDLVGELTELFVVEAKSRLDAIEGAIQDADTASLKIHTHSLKGSASTLGALRLAGVCKLMEVDAKAGALDDAASRLLDLRRLYDETREALAAQ